MSNISENFYKELGLQDLPEDKKEELSERLETTFQKFFLLELANLLSDEDITHIESLDKPEEVESFLESKNIDHEQIGLAVSEQMRSFIKEQMTYLQGYIDGTIDKNA